MKIHTHCRQNIGGQLCKDYKISLANRLSTIPSKQQAAVQACSSISQVCLLTVVFQQYFLKTLPFLPQRLSFFFVPFHVKMNKNNL